MTKATVLGDKYISHNNKENNNGWKIQQYSTSSSSKHV